jgi:acetylornithine/succinyldiaminopimelate/putrescine aminotransferase
MQAMEKLAVLRNSGGSVLTKGLSDAHVQRFLASDPRLAQAIDAAHAAYVDLSREYPDLMAADEAAQVRETQEGFINFYQEDNVNPYVAIAALGPWMITSKGAVVHDSGGYGMLGFGHAPEAVLSAMSRPHVMANVMTPSVSQHRFALALRREVGHTRGACPYSRFLCLNSGSEAVSLAGRIADINTRLMTDPGAPHAGWRVKRVAVKGSFHGRTELPAMYSDSTRKTYAQHLASPRHYEHTLITIEPYDVAQLRRVFEDADREHVHIEAMFLEPVMGEGNPGRAVPREFYAAAREVTRAHGTLLLIDSIQAGIRAQGVLSVVDYPGFEGLDAPDMETYSKALNAGQYPFSVLAVTEHAGNLYRKGVYGNTMTTNPRAMDVASTVLGLLTPELRRNIRERGAEFVQKLEKLATELPGYITRVQGSGLLVSCELAPQFKCYGAGSTEEFMRFHGYGVIHGGTNALRFTPPFNITSAEIDLVIDGVRDALVNGPRKSEPVVAERAQAAA